MTIKPWVDGQRSPPPSLELEYKRDEPNGSIIPIKQTKTTASSHPLILYQPLESDASWDFDSNYQLTYIPVRANADLRL